MKLFFFLVTNRHFPRHNLPEREKSWLHQSDARILHVLLAITSSHRSIHTDIEHVATAWTLRELCAHGAQGLHRVPPTSRNHKTTAISRRNRWSKTNWKSTESDYMWKATQIHQCKCCFCRSQALSRRTASGSGLRSCVLDHGNGRLHTTV